MLFTSKIPEECQEYYLPLNTADAQLLRDYGVTFSGVSKLVPGYHVGVRDPKDIMLILTTGGEGYFHTEELSIRLEPDTLLVAPPELPLEFGVTGKGWEISWFYIDRKSPWVKILRGDVLIEPTTLGRKLEYAMLGYLSESREATGISGLYAQIIIELLERLLPSECSETFDFDEGLERLWLEVQKNPGDAWTVDSLAEHYGCSATTLQRKVKHYYSRTPWQMVMGIRLEQAKVLLECTTYPLATIASRLGYADPFVFSAAFKRATGKSPRQYRQERRDS